MFGLLPAYGFFIRHASGIELDNVSVGFMREDGRPAFVIEDVDGIEFRGVKAQKVDGVPTFVLMDVENFRTLHSDPVADLRLERVERREF
jgi:hypothetical protein